jgi:hypothetical protein
MYKKMSFSPQKWPSLVYEVVSTNINNAVECISRHKGFPPFLSFQINKLRPYF